jgi:lipid II:glycine glycyltransferase (peptidoglycan interpeptide bridge formation enzyme)
LKIKKIVEMSAEQQLKQELAALRHELRRVSDSLERNRTRDMEQRARQLRASIELCERDLNQILSLAEDRSFVE